MWVIALIFLGVALVFLLNWNTFLGRPTQTVLGAPLFPVSMGVSIWLIATGVGLWYSQKWGVVLYALFGIIGIATLLITFIHNGKWGWFFLWAFLVLPHMNLVVSLWRETNFQKPERA
jgi:hypothetical protein